MVPKGKTDRLFALADELASATPDFFDTKGPGKGNHATNAYIRDLATKAKNAFGNDYSEQHICGDNALAVDFYFPDEAAIVEVALGLRNPNTEFEKDVLKAIMAKSLGHAVSVLEFIGKPGAMKKCSQPGRKAVKAWLHATHGIELRVRDLSAA